MSIILKLPLLIILALAANLIASPAFAETLADRMRALSPRPADLFHAPDSPTERDLLRTGELIFWKAYGTELLPQSSRFRGYTIFTDPYHFGLGRISFLLGADCSHFVQRLLQVLGAEFRYARTRHWITLSRQYQAGVAREKLVKPSDIPEVAWVDLVNNFRQVSTGVALEAGDVVVFAKAQGPLGEHGHIGLVSSREGFLLHAKGPDSGIVEEGFEMPSGSADVFVYRWVGSLHPLQGRTTREVLQGTYRNLGWGCHHVLDAPQNLP